MQLLKPFLSRYRLISALPILLLVCHNIAAQNPVVKVDLNTSERKESEVNEPGYIPWPIYGGPDSNIYEGVSFAFKNGGVGYSWYKAGVQAPYYARLVNDGIVTGLVELHISGLPVGKHTFTTYHNTFDNPLNNVFSPMDVYLNDTLVVDNLELTNRALSNTDATFLFFTFDAEEDKEIVFKFKADPDTVDALPTITICGFELNTSDPEKSALSPVPKDRDEHVDADNDSVTLRWSAANNAVSHDVYFGTNANEVSTADNSSPLFLGNQTDTFLLRTGFYSLNTYYWRVDEVDADGVTTKGNMWYFKKRIHAFPGAEGYGGYAIGGRGGSVVYVTNLNDDGPGSLREAIENDIGPRTIIFAVSGIIELDSRLAVNQKYVTIAGQTAPGKGICISRAPFGMSGAIDGVIRHVRVRVGSGITYDGMGMSGCDYSIIDHCSISWSIDEAFSSRTAKNITLQHTLISEALNVAGHQNYPEGFGHGYAGSVSGDISSLHHNLLAHNSGRNWSLAGGYDASGNYAGRIDNFNNIVYNWFDHACYNGAKEVNFVNNFYKKGPATPDDWPTILDVSGGGISAENSQRYYFTGNVSPGVDDILKQEVCLDSLYETDDPMFVSTWVCKPFFASYATIHTAVDAYKIVLSDVGCTQPVLDDHDKRVIYETLNGTYTYSGSYTGFPGLIDSEQDAGGWEDYPELMRVKSFDTDLDGMPDWWEKVNGTDTASASGDFSESNADPDSNGYTNLEEYLNWMGKPHYFTRPDSTLTIDLSQYTKGFTAQPLFTLSNIGNGSVSLVSDTVIIFTPVNQGLAQFTFTVTDSDGSSPSQDVGIFVGTVPADTAYIHTVDVEEPYVDNPVISIFPNPGHDFITISMPLSALSDVILNVYDIMGRSVMQHAINNTEEYLNIGNLPHGMYVFQFSSKDFIVNKRIVKQ